MKSLFTKNIHTFRRIVHKPGLRGSRLFSCLCWIYLRIWPRNISERRQKQRLCNLPKRGIQREEQEIYQENIRWFRLKQPDTNLGNRQQLWSNRAINCWKIRMPDCQEPCILYRDNYSYKISIWVQRCW